MTTKRIHWTACIGVTLSFWLLLWFALTLIYVLGWKDMLLMEQRQDNMIASAQGVVTAIEQEKRSTGLHRHIGWEYEFTYRHNGEDFTGRSMEYGGQSYSLHQPVTIELDPEYPQISQIAGTTNLIVTSGFLLGCAGVSLLSFASTVHFARTRLNAIKNAEFLTANIVRMSRSSYMQFTLEKKRYEKIVVNDFAVRKRDKIEIVYNRLKPGQFYRTSFMKAKYRTDTGEWRSSPLQVIPRLLAFLVIIVMFFSLLFSS